VEICIGHLGDFIESKSLSLSDHERDAALGAGGSWAMINRRSGWRDLYRKEDTRLLRVACRVLDANRNRHLTTNQRTGHLFRGTRRRSPHSSGVTDYYRPAFLQLSAGAFKLLAIRFSSWKDSLILGGKDLAGEIVECVVEPLLLLFGAQNESDWRFSPGFIQCSRA